MPNPRRTPASARCRARRRGARRCAACRTRNRTALSSHNVSLSLETQTIPPPFDAQRGVRRPTVATRRHLSKHYPIRTSRPRRRPAAAQIQAPVAASSLEVARDGAQLQHEEAVEVLGVDSWAGRKGRPRGASGEASGRAGEPGTGQGVMGNSNWGVAHLRTPSQVVVWVSLVLGAAGHGRN